MEFEFPDTGEGVTEGKFLDWKIEEGDEIEEDQVVGEAETDKAVVEIPAPADGTVEKLKTSPGDMVEVGEVIMELKTGENTETDTEKKRDTDKSIKDKKEISQTDETSENSSNNVLALPKVRKLAKEKGIELESIKTGERITEEEVLNTADSEDSENEENVKNDSGLSNVNATPSVRKLAREKEVNLSKVDGSGRGGKITRDDVLNFTESSQEQNREDEITKEVSNEREVERVEMSNVRRKTAEKMTESRFTAPHVTHIEKVDMTHLRELREEEKDKVEPHLTYLPFMIKAVVDALKSFPNLNAELDEESNEIIRKKYYDFNIAVETGQGLMVPKITDVDDKSIVNLASEISNKAEKAREQELPAKDMKNGSFSITNLGVIGGQAFTPIINYPQTAILGVGKIGETAEVVNGGVEPRTTVKLSLSYDHRVVDGATAARFMNKLKQNLENPEKMLLGL